METLTGTGDQLLTLKGKFEKTLRAVIKTSVTPPDPPVSVCGSTGGHNQSWPEASPGWRDHCWTKVVQQGDTWHGRGQLSEGCSVCYRECSFVWGHSMLLFSKDGQSMPWVHQDLIFHSKWIISYSILYLVCPYSRSWSRSQQWGSANLNNPFILIHLSLNKVPAFFFRDHGGKPECLRQKSKRGQHSNCCATVCALN